MISLYFGLPGSGKTTLLARHALKASKRYKHVYVNVYLRYMPPNVVYVPASYIGKYDMHDCLILIDEGSIHFDNRDYKNTDKGFLRYIIMHRHHHADINVYTQYYNGVDIKLRRLCDRVYYVFRSHFFGSIMTSYWRVPYGIIIPDQKANKESNGTQLGDIQEGYSRPPLLVRLLCHRVLRPRYYKYFDSWHLDLEDILPNLPV